MMNSYEPTIARLCSAANELFLTEARICAEPDPNRNPNPASNSERLPVLGYGAMSLALACMTALGEALLQLQKPEAKNSSDCDFISAFVEYAKPSDFGIIGLTKLKEPDAAKLFCRLRNSLAHALSMPNDLRLENTRDDLDPLWPHAYIIPGEFVSHVSATVARLAKEYGQKVFRDTRTDRSIATVGTRQEGTYHITAGSTPGVSPYPPVDNHSPKK